MKAMIKSALVCLMALAAVSVSAQQPQGQGQRQRQTPEERAKQRTEQLKKDLGLNDTQKKQVYDLQLKSAKEMETMRGQQGGQQDRGKMMEQMEKRTKEMSAEMKKILTDTQFAKWEKQQKERQQNMGRGQGGQRPPRQS